MSQVHQALLTNQIQVHDVKENDEQFRNEYREYAEEYFRRLGSTEIKAQ